MSTTQRRSGLSPGLLVSDRNHLGLGAVLALAAGLVSMAVLNWPLVAATRPVDIAPIGQLVRLGAGAAYILGFILTGHSLPPARTLLVAGAAAQLFAAGALGPAFETQGGLTGQPGGLADFLPAIVALTAALLIERAPARAKPTRPVVNLAASARTAPRPRRKRGGLRATPAGSRRPYLAR
jgi:hypothetical protein